MPRRVLKATAVIVACVALCVVVQTALDAPHAGIAEKLEAATGSASTQVEDADALALLPEGFQEEVLPLAGREDVRVSGQGAVVGFLERTGAATAFAALSAELEGAGWTPVQSGRDDCGSFVKDSGRFTWLFVSCVWTGEATSVVVSCAAPQG